MTQIEILRLINNKAPVSYSDGETNKVACPECGKLLKNAQALAGHLRFAHAKSIPSKTEFTEPRALNKPTEQVSPVPPLSEEKLRWCQHHQ